MAISAPRDLIEREAGRKISAGEGSGVQGGCFKERKLMCVCVGGAAGLTQRRGALWLCEKESVIMGKNSRQGEVQIKAVHNPCPSTPIHHQSLLSWQNFNRHA